MNKESRKDLLRRALVQVKPKYSYIYDSSEIIFVSQFLDDMTQKAKKSELTSSNLLDIITDQIVEKFYTIKLEKAEDVYISAKEYADLYYPCIIYIVKNSIRDQVNDLYPNFMVYMNFTEEEYNQAPVYKKIVNRAYHDLLSVFFVRNIK